MNDFLIKLIVVQTVIFGLVIFFLKRVLTKDTESSVNRLETSYEEVKKKKEELAQKMLEIENEYKKRKEEAERIAQELKEKAYQEAAGIRDEAFKKAKVESEDIISKAHKTVAKVREDIKKEEESHMIDTCAHLLSNVFAQHSLEALHRAVVSDFIAELAATDLNRVGIDCTTVEFISFQPVLEEDRQKVRAAIASKIKREFTFTEKTDTALLAGMVVRFGSLTLDGSLASKLREAALLAKQSIEERT